MLQHKQPTAARNLRSDHLGPPCDTWVVVVFGQTIDDVNNTMPKLIEASNVLSLALSAPTPPSVSFPPFVHPLGPLQLSFPVAPTALASLVRALSASRVLVLALVLMPGLPPLPLACTRFPSLCSSLESAKA